MSAPLRLDREDLRKLGRSLLIASLGAALPVLSDFLAHTDFGLAGPVVTAIGSVAVDLIRRLLQDSSSTT
jgi:hypothetical protein